MKVVITRAFAYLNPRRQDLFASAFAKKIAEIERGEREIMTHGNLDSIRTLIDVRDIAEAYWLACQHCEYGKPYNVGGETVISVGEFLDLLKKKATVKIESEVDKALLRPVDVTLQVPDVSKFVEATGWKPKYSFEDSVEFLLDHFIGIVTGKQSFVNF